MPSKGIFALVLVGVVLWVLLALLSGRGGQEKGRAPEPPASQSATGEVVTSGTLVYEFVGQVEGTKALVAVVADKTITESPDKTVVEDTSKTVVESTRETTAARGGRRVQAYVCDGEPQGNAEWFTGQMTGNELDLTSVSRRARLQAALTEEEATGAVALADGTLRRFTASAAHDGAGLYEVTIASDGRRTGTSANGAEDEGRVSPDGVWTTGTIRLPSGEAVDYRRRETAGHQGGSKPDTYMTIILPDSEQERGRGGNIKTNEPSSNFISSDFHL